MGLFYGVTEKVSMILSSVPGSASAPQVHLYQEGEGRTLGTGRDHCDGGISVAATAPFDVAANVLVGGPGSDTASYPAA